LLYGARTSLSVGLLTQIIVLGIGLPVGAIAGLAGGRTDNVIMRLVDVVYAFPDLLLIMLLRSIFGGSIVMMFVAIGLVEWSTIARLARGQVLALKSQEYVLAAWALGATWRQVLVRHLLPNGISPIIVATVFGIPRAIFAEAALSYIGIGVQPPTPSWGTMVQEGYQAIFAFPHLILAPAIAIALLTLSFTFLGDGLRDALDPQASR
jgi:oligopeptide transport system permease protein